MFDMFGMNNAFQNQAIQQLGSQAIDPNARSKATLFLFSRRQIPDQYRRPQLYNFGGEFRQALQENLERSQKGGAYNYLSALMLDAPIARTAIMPSANGQHMNLKSFGDLWTFVLVMDNDMGLTPLGTRSNLSSRSIASGWVMDEPVTKTNMSAGYTPNPGAILCVGHHTSLSVTPTVTASGTHYHPHTTGDYDYLAPTVTQQVTTDGQQLYNLMPNRVLNSMVVDPHDTYSYSLAASPLVTAQDSVEMSCDFNSPTQHLGTIVRATVDALKHQYNTENSDIFAGTDVFMGTVGAMLSPGQNINTSSIDVTKPIIMDQLIRQFGTSLDIVVCKQPETLQYDITTAQAPTRRNVFSSLLSTAIPSLLASVGLAEVAFRYNSSVSAGGGMGSFNGDKGVFEVYNISALHGNNSAVINSGWEQLQQLLKHTVFPIILNSGGHFDLMMHCSLAGASLVNLQLLDEVVEGGLIETNNLLGGLNTSLVGTMHELSHNASQLYGAMGDTIATGTPADGLFSHPIDGTLPLF